MNQLPSEDQGDPVLTREFGAIRKEVLKNQMAVGMVRDLQGQNEMMPSPEPGAFPALANMFNTNSQLTNTLLTGIMEMKKHPDGANDPYIRMLEKELAEVKANMASGTPQDPLVIYQKMGEIINGLRASMGAPPSAAPPTVTDATVALQIKQLELSDRAEQRRHDERMAQISADRSSREVDSDRLFKIEVMKFNQGNTKMRGFLDSFSDAAQAIAAGFQSGGAPSNGVASQPSGQTVGQQAAPKSRPPFINCSQCEAVVVVSRTERIGQCAECGTRYDWVQSENMGAPAIVVEAED